LTFRLSTPQGNYRVRSRELVVANGRYVAGPIAATPGASVQDGRFDVFTLGNTRLGGFLRASLG
jgi:diacylglycerol kinase (ATP)